MSDETEDSKCQKVELKHVSHSGTKKKKYLAPEYKI